MYRIKKTTISTPSEGLKPPNQLTAQTKIICCLFSSAEWQNKLIKVITNIVITLLDREMLVVLCDVEGHLSTDDSARLIKVNWSPQRSDLSSNAGNEANGIQRKQ